MNTATLEDQIVDEPLYEIVDGQRVELLPMGAYETSVAGRLFALLFAFVSSQRLGRAEVEALFDLPNVNRQRRPDVAYISKERWPLERSAPRSEAWPIAPDLAAEVISPTETAWAVQNKVLEYFRAKVRQVWLIWPNSEQVHILDGPTLIRVLTAADVLEGEPLLPGFRLPVASLFEPADDAQ